MAEELYGFIKNNEVVNVVVFDNPDAELLSQFKELHSVDSIIKATDKTKVGGTYDGKRFWLPKPYPSWVKGKEDWEAPVPMPEIDPNSLTAYYWDEETTSWKEALPPT